MLEQSELEIDGYQIREKLEEISGKLLYRALDSNRQPVILKILKSDFSDPYSMARFRREFQIGRNIKSDHIIRIHHLFDSRQGLVMVTEDIDGYPLRYYMDNGFYLQGRSEIQKYLQIALNLSTAVGEVHRHKLIHRIINPGNIILRLGDLTVMLTNFSAATELQSLQATQSLTEWEKDDLQYISPEQTGRMNRPVDYRSDYYSLGVVLYELFTGSRPFDSNNELELIYSHIARNPVPPVELNKLIPKTVSDIIMKLLQKNAEDRYQSSIGIVEDWKQCLKDWDNNKKVSIFSPGLKDIPNQFIISQKLYGRKKEIETLTETFHRVCDASNIEILLVKGYSGVGKSALVNELQTASTQRNGLFVSARFDLLNRNTPFEALIQAFQELIHKILMESSDRIDQWKIKILNGLGSDTDIILRAIPDLKMIVGQQSIQTNLTPEEEQRRFPHAIQSFLRLLMHPMHPLVLFLDDIQWADLPTLQMLQNVISDNRKGPFLLICSYRDNEIDETHPILVGLLNLEKDGIHIVRIQINELSIHHITTLLSDTLAADPEDVSPLARCCFRKTRGNPFFLNQFLIKMHDAGLIRMDPVQGGWTYDLDRIDQASETENVIELIGSSIQALPRDTRETLMFAACIGSEFDLNTLSVIRNTSRKQIARELKTAVMASLLSSAGEQFRIAEFMDDVENLVFRFPHDEIMKSAYSLLTPELCSEIHLKIGKLMLNNFLPSEREKKLFLIVGHLNSGSHWMDEGERIDLAELNLQAGRKAYAIAAYGQALQYFNRGLELLPDDSWESRYDLTLALHTDAAGVCYINYDFDRLAAIVEVVNDRHRSFLDIIRVVELQILSYLAQNRLKDGVELSLQSLEKLGYRIKKNPGRLENLMLFSGTFALSLFYSHEKLHRLPPLKSPRRKAAMQIMAASLSAVFYTNPALMMQFGLRMVRISLIHGISIYSPVAFIIYGLLVAFIPGFINIGYRWGKSSIDLLEKLDGQEEQAQCTAIFNSVLRHWKEPANKVIRQLFRAYRMGRETGDLEYAVGSLVMALLYRFLTGDKLKDLDHDVRKHIPSLGHIQEITSLHHIHILTETVGNIIRVKDDSISLSGEFYKEKDMLAIHLRANDHAVLATFYMMKMILCYHMKNIREAREMDELAQKHMNSVLGFMMYSYIHFYSCLISLAAWTDASPDEKKQLNHRISRSAKMLRKWSKSSPENYLSLYYLVEAERNRIYEKHSRAIEYYELAGNHAEQNQQHNIRALSHELAGNYWTTRGKNDLASVYFTSAARCYLDWGAEAFANRLELDYGNILKWRKPTIVQNLSHSGENVDRIDYMSILKAAQNISMEINLERLLKKTMEIIVENAGAESGLFIIKKNETWYVEASTGPNIKDQRTNVRVLENIPLEQYESISHGVVNYVARTKENVVLGDASREGLFVNDPYIMKSRTRSLLCVPINNHGMVIGVLYLENNLTNNAFSRDRIELLNILLSHVGISLENAKLYTRMEEMVEDRTRDLVSALRKVQEEREKSDNLLLNILPRAVADELKENGEVIPQDYDSTTILFADIKNFTGMAHDLSPEELVKELNSLFLQFDYIMDNYKVEKLKTIGDAYMCAGGLPIANRTHPVDVCMAALEIKNLIELTQELRADSGARIIEVRVGIHSGPVIAGVIGKNKFNYDVWGDTVNIAASMEAAGEAGKINISANTYEMVKDFFECEFRGKLDIKHGDEMEMYYITGIKKELARPDDPNAPGYAFYEKYDQLSG